MSVFGVNGEMQMLNEAEVDADAQSRSELHLSLQVATARRSPAPRYSLLSQRERAACPAK